MDSFIGKFDVLEIKRYYHYFFGSDYVFHGHRHTEWEINAVLQGEMEITYEDQILTIPAGGFFLCEPNKFHRSRAVSHAQIELIVLQFHTSSITSSSAPMSFVLSEEEKELLHLIISDCERFEATQKTRINDCHMVYATTRKLLEVLLSRLLEQSTAPVFLESKESAIYRRAVSYLKEHLHTQVTIRELSRFCQTNETNLKKIFSLYTGRGINYYFTSLKAEEIKRLIRGGERLCEISDKLGFSSQAYLTRTFRRIYGITPMEFKHSLFP